MSYCIINNHPVFLYSSRQKEIQERALKGKSAVQKIDSIIAGVKKGEEVGDFVADFLKGQFEEDPVNFHTNWAVFDISGDEAAQEGWELLCDYCDYHRYGYLSDLGDYAPQLTDDSTEESPRIPVGQIFVLNHLVKPSRWWWRYTRKMSGRTVSLVIVAKNVNRLVGDLTNFTIYAKDLRISCGPNFSIYPVLKEKGSE